MNLSIFNSKSHTARLVRAALLAAILFFLFDRGLFFLLREAAFEFYSSGDVGKDWYGKTEVVEKNYFNTLIMGTSRTKEGIHPVYIFEKLGYRAYNAASPGRYPQFNYLFYQNFKKRNGIPRVVILGIDYFLFSKDSNRRQLLDLQGERTKGKHRINYHDVTNPNSKFLSRISLLYRTKATLDQFFADAVEQKRVARRGVEIHRPLRQCAEPHIAAASPLAKIPLHSVSGKRGDIFQTIIGHVATGPGEGFFGGNSRLYQGIRDQSPASETGGRRREVGLAVYERRLFQLQYSPIVRVGQSPSICGRGLWKEDFPFVGFRI